MSVFEASTLSSRLAPRWSVNDGRQNDGPLIYNLHRVIFGCDLFVKKQALLCESEFCTRAAGIVFFLTKLPNSQVPANRLGTLYS